VWYSAIILRNICDEDFVEKNYVKKQKGLNICSGCQNHYLAELVGTAYRPWESPLRFAYLPILRHFFIEKSTCKMGKA
jgi:hypothetical protein